MVNLKEDQALDRSKDKLKRDVEKIITSLFDHVLDISEVAIGDPLRYKPFRAKVLRAGNDAIREMKKVLDRDYRVLYVPTNEDVIEVQSPSVSIRRKN
jgi:hypothetical protein